VLGEVRGKDILEPLGRVLQKASLNVELPPELEKLIVPRPTAYIFACQVIRLDNKAEAYAVGAKTAGRPYPIKPVLEVKHDKSEIPDQSLSEVT
jgi:hypothetical protein